MAAIFMYFPGWRRKAFTTSYDDGVEQDARLIGIMRKNGIKGTFNLNGEALLKDEYKYPEGQVHRRMGKRMALETYSDSGMEIAVHTFTHPFLDRLPQPMATYEVIKDREILEDTFDRIVRGMAYPMGTYNDMTVEVLKNSGIAYSRTIESTGKFDIPTDWLRMPATCHHNDPRVTELADKFVNEAPSGFPWLFYLWGHTYEFEINNNWEHIENLLAKIGGHDDIWYATNIAIHDYVEAYRSLIFGVRGNTVYNPTCTGVYFQYAGKDVFAKPGEETLF